MANSDRHWYGGSPQRGAWGYNRSLLDNYQVNDEASLVSLFPDKKALSKDDHASSSRDAFSARSEPPWKRRREDYGLREDPRTDPTPNLGPDGWSKNPQDWNRQRGSLNLRSNMSTQSGLNRDEIPYEDSWRYRQDENRWNDKMAMGNELSGWNNLLPRPNVSSIMRPHSPFEQSQMNRFNESPRLWSGPPGRFNQPPMWANRFQEHENRPDRVERPFEQTGYNEPREWGREERDWSGRSSNDLNDRRPSELMGGFDRKTNKQQDWNDRSHCHDVPELMNINRPNISKEWTYLTNEQSLREVENKSQMSRESNFNMQDNFIKGNLKRTYDMMGGRSPDKRNVWSRLDQGQLKDELSEIKKRLKMSEQFNLGLSGQALSTQERAELKPKYRLPTHSRIKHDLRDKILQRESDATEEMRTNYNVIFFPLGKKSKFKIEDVTNLQEKLIAALYKLAQSDDLENLPQLRFKHVKMISKTRIVVECQDATTASWLLKWNLGWTRFPIRRSLTQDLRRLAFISFVMKGTFNIHSESIKPVLKLQNPGLDVSAWTDGGTRNTKKGTTYVFRVDGHSIRYLTHNNWSLYYGLNKFHVRRIKSNFVYEPEDYMCI